MFGMSYEQGTETGLIPLESVEGVEVAAVMAADLRALLVACRAAGHAPRLTSGFRRVEKQRELYAKYIAGTGNVAAVPGYSNHQRGSIDSGRQRGPAVDIGNLGGFEGGAYQWMAEHAQAYGFSNAEGRGVNEPWHWCYIGRQSPASALLDSVGRDANYALWPLVGAVPLFTIAALGGSLMRTILIVYGVLGLITTYVNFRRGAQGQSHWKGLTDNEGIQAVSTVALWPITLANIVMG